MTTNYLGDSVPKPLGFSASGNREGQERKAEQICPAPPSSTRLGARVAPQRCPVLRAGDIIITGFH
jgi:hypothetical protein